MAVEDIPESQIRNVRTSYSQYLWQLPSSSYYRWDEDITYMYRVGATPVPGQGLPPTPPPPPVQSPFTRGEMIYLDGHYVLVERRVSTGEGLQGGGDLSVDREIKLSDSALASLALANSALQRKDIAVIDRDGRLGLNGQGGPLDGTDDFNTKIWSGFYRVYNGKNAPVGGEWFYVLVQAHDERFIYQQATGYAGTAKGLTYERQMNDGVWGSWRMTVDTNGAVDNVLRSILNPAERVGPKSMLKSSTDLNVLLDNGWYAGSSLANAPSNDQGFFYISVQRSADSSFYARQEATRAGVGVGLVGSIYHRYAEGQTNGVTQWSPWVRLSDKDGALDPTARSSANDLQSRFGQRVAGISSTDLNTRVATGLYSGYGMVNAPANGNLYVRVTAHGAEGWVMQEAYEFANNDSTASTTRRAWLRHNQNGTWTPWLQIGDVNGALDGALRGDINNRMRYNAFDVGAAKDVNTITDSGWYLGGSGNPNSPYSGRWLMDVRTAATGYSYQRFMSLTGIPGAVWERYTNSGSSGGSWSPWVQVVDANGAVDKTTRDDIAARMNPTSTAVSGSNFNDLKTSGWYRGNNMTNGPMGSQFAWHFLQVITDDSRSWAEQRVTVFYGGDPAPAYEHDSYVRWLRGGTWTAWKKTGEEAGGFDSTARARADLAAFASLPTARDLYAADSWNRTRFGLTLAANQAPTLAMLYGAVPIDSTYVADGGDLGQNMGDNYVGQLRTMVRVTAAKTISLTLTHDDGAQFYVDGKSVYSAPAYTQGVTVQFTLTVGWHILDWLWLEQAGGDGIFGISPTLRSQVDEMFAPVSETRRASDAASAVKTVNGTAPDANGNVVVSGGGGGGTGTVQSVNGKGPNGSGAVTLVPADIGAPPTTRAISPGTGLQGGGDLSADRTLSLSTAAQASLSKADSAVQPSGLQLLQPKRRRIAFFGDSWGTQLYSPDPAMPNMLATALNADLVANHAISGSVLGPVGTSNSGGIERNTDTMVNNAKADTSYDKNSITDVVLVIGVNNILTYFPSMAQAITNFKNIAALYPNARFWYAANSKKSINMTGDTDPWKFYSRFMEAASLAGWAAANSSPQWTWGVTADTATWWPSDSVATTRHPTTAGLQAYAGRLAGFMEGESWKPFFRVPITIHADAVALNSSARISNDTTRVDGTLLMLDFAVASMSNSSASTASYQNAASIPERYAPNVPFYYTPVGTREGGGAMNFTYAGQVGAASGVVSVDARVVRTNVSYFVFHAAVPLNAFLALDAS